MRPETGAAAVFLVGIIVRTKTLWLLVFAVRAVGIFARTPTFATETFIEFSIRDRHNACDEVSINSLQAVRKSRAALLRFIDEDYVLIIASNRLRRLHDVFIALML